MREPELPGERIQRHLRPGLSKRKQGGLMRAVGRKSQVLVLQITHSHALHQPRRLVFNAARLAPTAL
ncbi:MAG: hypothetical protein JKY65_21425 [Planctomycetes bacterium]|nr:hypothetical protein [Planctomycetota bacterium]